MSARELWLRNVRRVYLWRSLTMLHFFAGSLVPFFTEWGGITLAQLFYLQAWFFLWIFVLEVPTGAVADKWGRKASLICATVSLILAVVVYASGKGLVRFLIAEVIWAAASAFASGADEALVYDSLRAAGAEDKSKEALGRLASFEIGAIAAAAPIGSLMAARWGLLTPLVAMLVPFVLSFFAALTLKEPPAEEEVTPDYRAVLTRGVRYFASHAALRALAFDSVTVWMLSFMTIWLFQPRLAELGVGVKWYGFVTAACTIAQIALLSRTDAVERFFGGTRRYLTWSAVLPALAYFTLPFVRSPLAVSALFVVVTGFGLSRTVVISNYLNKHVDNARRATVLSSVGMARQLTGAVVFPCVGLLTKLSLEWTFAALGAAILVCAALSSVEEAHLK